MADAGATEDPDLPAGDFSAWVVDIQGAIRGRRTSEVPCGECTACCTGSQFVHIAPDETDTLARVPRELMFPAPGLPAGHVLLPYDDRGHCPMLVDGRCSIYADRPRTCRTYDCRVFAAAGVEPEEPAAALIARRVRRWRFDLPAEDDRTRMAAVRAASAFLRLRAADLGEGHPPTNSTQRAVLAVRIHEVFLDHDEATGRLSLAEPTAAEVRAAVARAAGPQT